MSLLITLYSCKDEDDTSASCGKWEVEINNPDATVSIENGSLIVNIPNPKTFKDVRLIQHQAKDQQYSQVGLWLNARIDAEPIELGNTVMAEIRASFGYEVANGASFIGKSVTSEGWYKGFVNDRQAWHSQTGSFIFYAKGTEAKFEENHNFNPVEIPMVSAAPKVLYLDFGVDPSVAHLNPIASLHAEVELIQFGDYTPHGSIYKHGQNQEYLGFKLDQFDCNSLIR
uniref:Uncharacterized protein n=1 Tax=Roseihalotalea indica TaxID=2867963 RepID=A0AA49GPV6_9BACT|nr:hypothetical protein K4G66_08850 [Tunicatimonas sp. TK19036]